MKHLKALYCRYLVTLKESLFTVFNWHSSIQDILTSILVLVTSPIFVWLPLYVAKHDIEHYADPKYDGAYFSNYTVYGLDPTDFKRNKYQRYR